MSRYVVHTEIGSPDVLHVITGDADAPGAGQVAVRVEAAGVNPIDHKLRSGARPTPPIAEPRRVGGDGAGVVTAVGADVEGFRVGQPVAIFDAIGTYATDIVVDAACLAPRPASVSASQAAALGVPFGTAYQTLRSLAVGPGDTVLVHAGSGAVGQAVIQFAVLSGARVIATTSDARASRVRALGAESVSYAPGIADRVAALAPGGISAAIDIAGTDEALQSSLTLVADRGRIATLVRGADAPSLGIRAFMGGSPRPLTAQERSWRAEAIPLALALLASGTFSVELGPTFTLDEAPAAHRAVEAGTPGKVVLVP